MPPPTVRDIGSRLELLVDRFLIDRLTGCRQQLAKPRFGGVAVRFDLPWEGMFAACITAIRDGKRYRMYYRGMAEARPDGSDIECTCYAESTDGVNWDKPQLDLYSYPGYAKTNIVLHHLPPASHNFAPFIDARPGVPESERYKAVAGVNASGIFIFASADGLRWRRLRDTPVIAPQPFAFDSHNAAFWSEHEGKYVFYFRSWRPLGEKKEWGARWISRCESDDFVHWSERREMEADPAEPIEQIYTHGTRPYFRAPHLYIALAARFMQDKRVLTDAQASTLGVAKDYYGDCSDTVLMTSRGGISYDRTFLESFVRPGAGLENWVSRTNYAGLGIVPTGEREMSFYTTRAYAQPTSHAARYALRTDGFASVNAPYAGGELLTHPLTFTGRELVLNYETSAAGFVRVELCDPQGQPIPGYALGDGHPLVGDEIEGVYRWPTGDLSGLAGRPLRLRFVMCDADLYALRFR